MHNIYLIIEYLGKELCIMKTGFAKTMFTGAMVGMAAGMLLLPELDHGTKRRIRKSGKILRNRAENMYDDFKGWMR